MNVKSVGRSIFIHFAWRMLFTKMIHGTVMLAKRVVSQVNGIVNLAIHVPMELHYRVTGVVRNLPMPSE